MATFNITNERNEPLIGVEVEFVSPTGRILARGITGASGQVTFAQYSERDGYPRPMITRNSGKSGEMTNTGQVRVNPVADPPAVVEAARERAESERFPAKLLDASTVGQTKGLLRWNDAGILEFNNGATWQELGPELPTSDPGNGELWLECPP